MRVKANKGAGGVDKESIEKFEENLEVNIERIHQELKRNEYRPQPVRRVWIPKPNGEKRGLGIPAVRDRVVQQAARIRLEPIFEPTFVESSYGFRPNRSAHQAIDEVSMWLRKGHWWVMEADIKGYFDNIPHEKLIDLVAERVSDGRVLRLIRSFLKAGVMEELKVSEQVKGTPQGGVISPLLANIYLNYYDQKMIKEGFKIIRFADDFVVMCKTEREAERARELTQKILEEELELKLHPTKTRVVHINKGFEFLGFLFKRGYNIYVYPRDKAIRAFKDKVRRITRRKNPYRMSEMVRRLNKVIVGWGNYFKKGGTRKLFWRLDRWIRRRVRAFKAKRWRSENWEKYTNKFLRDCVGLRSLYGLLI